MAFLGAYFDRSSDQPNEIITVVGGVVSTVEEWKGFNEKWSATLIEYGLPFFHMTDFEKGEGFFKGWSKEKKHSLLGALLEIMKTSVNFCLVTHITKKEFEAERDKRMSLLRSEELNEKMRRLLPYHVCTEEVSGFIYRYAAEQGYEKNFSLTFDRGEKVLSDVVSLYDLKNLYGNVGRANKQDVKPLQAADIIAYEAMKEAINSPEDKHPIRYPFEYLLKHINLKALDCNPAVLANFFDAWMDYYDSKS